MGTLIWMAVCVLAGAGAIVTWRCWHRPVRLPDPVSDHHEARERFPERKP